MMPTRRRRRVFHLIKSLGRGGAEVLLTEGLRCADRDRFEYSYGYFLHDTVAASLRAQDAEVTCFETADTARILLSARRVAAHLRSRRVDLLHCHLPITGVIGRIAGRLAGVPVVYSEHNKQERYHPLTRRLNRLTWGWQERVIAVSADVAESIARNIGRDVRVETVLNGVDADRFRRSAEDGAAVRATFGIPRDALVVGSVAVFRVQKRLDDWLEAARMIRRDHPAARFLLVGFGPLDAELKRHADDLGLGEILHFTGPQEDVRPYLSAIDVYMMSSIVEGLPVALLEAMAMECAPVCTSVGGIPEVIVEGDNGLMVPARDPRALASAAGRLLGDTDELARIARRARITTLERFGMRHMSERLERVYMDVLEGRSTERPVAAATGSATIA